MAISTQTITPEQMRSVVIQHFKRFDRELAEIPA
jgi:hypothetical protein